MRTIILILAIILLNINITKSKDRILTLKPEEMVTKPIKKQKSKKILIKTNPIKITEEIIYLLDSMTTQRYSTIPLKSYKADSDGGSVISIEKVYRLHKNLKIKNKKINTQKDKEQEKIKYLHYIIQDDNIS